MLSALINNTQFFFSSMLKMCVIIILFYDVRTNLIIFVVVCRKKNTWAREKWTWKSLGCCPLVRQKFVAAAAGKRVPSRLPMAVVVHRMFYLKQKTHSTPHHKKTENNLGWLILFVGGWVGGLGLLWWVGIFRFRLQVYLQGRERRFRLGFLAGVRIYAA